MPASSFRERGPPELGCSCGRAARSREIVHDELAKLTDRARVLLRTSPRLGYAARSLSTNLAWLRIITNGGKPAGTMSRRNPARNHFKFGLQDMRKDLSTRQVGKSFTGSLTLTVSGLICAPTASSSLISVR